MTRLITFAVSMVLFAGLIGCGDSSNEVAELRAELAEVKTELKKLTEMKEEYPDKEEYLDKKDDSKSDSISLGDECKETPNFTLEKCEVLDHAEIALGQLGGTSRIGAIEYLTLIEGHSYEDSVEALNYFKPDYIEQAVEEARFRLYETYPAFSKRSLVEFLVVSQKFTIEEALYGVEALDADWKEQASLRVDRILDLASTPFSEIAIGDNMIASLAPWDPSSAISLLALWQTDSFTRDAINAQLVSEGYGTEERKYALDMAGL